MGRATLKVPVIDHWWQTETGAPITHNPVGPSTLPVKYGRRRADARPDVRVLDDAGHEVLHGTLGNVAEASLPPACLPTLWNADRRFPSGLSRRVSRLPRQDHRGRRIGRRDGYLFVMWRAPTTSSASPTIACRPAAWRRFCGLASGRRQCAVISVHDEMKGQMPAWC